MIMIALEIPARVRDASRAVTGAVVLSSEVAGSTKLFDASAGAALHKIIHEFA